MLGTEIPSDKPEQVKGFRCVEENGFYKFKLGIVPKKIGNFVIGLSDATGVYRKTNECDKAAFSLTFKDTDQHLSLYEEKRPGYVLSNYDKGHLYAFKVY